jgi:hypothetical protein
LILAGSTVPMAALFVVIFGAANGLLTILRGVLPLHLFGADGYGRLMGRIAAPYLAMQASAPLVMALIVEHVSDAAAMGFAALCALMALGCFVLLRRA